MLAYIKLTFAKFVILGFLNIITSIIAINKSSIVIGSNNFFIKP